MRFKNFLYNNLNSYLNLPISCVLIYDKLIITSLHSIAFKISSLVTYLKCCQNNK